MSALRIPVYELPGHEVHVALVGAGGVAFVHPVQRLRDADRLVVYRVGAANEARQATETCSEAAPSSTRNP